MTGREARAALATVREWSRDLTALESSARLLQWDQETAMTRGAGPSRALVLGRIAGLVHRELVRPDVEEPLALLAALPADKRSADAAALVCESRRRRARAIRVPEALVRELTETISISIQGWAEALRSGGFETFAPHLERLVALRREEAAHLDVGDELYDSLLDVYDPGLRTADVVPVLDTLVTELQSLLAQIPTPRAKVDWTPWIGADLSGLMHEIAAQVGYDPTRGGFARSSHPFCMRIHHHDVRLTTRRASADPFDDVFSTLHELGHALYDQANPDALHDTLLGEPISLAAHESQSRFYENHIGRSRAFWEWCGPRLRKALGGQTRTLTTARLHAEAIRVERSLVRTEADEVTYGLHIALRTRLEMALFRDELGVRDLPDAWEAQTSDLLGIVPTSAATGVLQDLHWAEGAFGYFPTYSLGDIYAAQLAEAAERALGPLEEVVAEEGPLPITAFLKERVHRHAGRYLTADLMRRATGEEMSVAPLVRHLRRRYVDEAA